MIDELPVLAICGYSGAGKTTLILKLLEVLCTQRQLSVAILKNDVHGLTIDQPGKDTDRFFEAGADVYARGPKQSFQRAHPVIREDFYARLGELAERYDFILVEGHKSIPLPKVWLLSDGESETPQDIEGVLDVLDRDADRLSPVLARVQERLRIGHDQAPVYGAVLIGGKSRRMGQAKHLLKRDDGQTWLAYTLACLDKVCHKLVICGSGAVPEPLNRYPQLPDAPDARGPMAGILAAMRWRPRARWLVAACDLPHLHVGALHWLLNQRTPGVWGVVPRLDGAPGVEPLLAYYDGRCRRLFEALAAQENYCPLPVTKHKRVLTPMVPPDLANAWHNANTPEALAPTSNNNNNRDLA